MAAGGSLKFVVEVAADNATKTLQSIQTAVDQAGVKMKTTMLGVGDAGRASSGHIGGLEGRLKSLKTEMGQGDRTINFFANTITGSLIPATSKGGEALRLFADGLVGGVGIGFGIQAVAFGIKL